MMILTKAQVDEIETRAEKATAGAWRYEPDIRPDIFTEDGKGGYFDAGHLGHLSKYDNNCRDAEFIAASRQDIPALVATVRELEQEISRLTHSVIREGYEFCAVCGTALGCEEDDGRTH